MILWPLAFTSFVACAVEAVEAATIVLAVGQTGRMGAALRGAALALLALLAIVAVGGPLIVTFVPERVLHVGLGAFLIWYAWGWLRKSVLRFAGRIPLHDEDAIYAHHREALQSGSESRSAQSVAFGGVFVEGTEVAIIVISVGSDSAAGLASAGLGALAAAALVAAAAAIARRPLARVPENAMKFFVGVMLATFGIFWLGEGVGLAWWHGDLALAPLALLLFGFASLAVQLAKRPSFRAATREGTRVE